MTWADVSLREFQDALASSAPTPGGGSAAGVALGQAAALAVMVEGLKDELSARRAAIRSSPADLPPAPKV